MQVDSLPTELSKQTYDKFMLIKTLGHPSWLSGKESACNAGVRSLGQEDSLEKEMATHSCIFAWEIPWREKPGGYSPHGHKKAGMT